MDPTSQQTPQPAQGSGLALAVRLTLVVVFIGLLTGVAYVLSVNKNSQTTTGQKETSQQNKKESVVDKTIPKNYVPTTTEEKKMAENLKNYGVACMRFTSLDEALKTPDIACVLDLSGKNLSSLPSTLTTLTSLNTINLSNNNFSEFPSQLLEILTLQSIDLSKNRLTITPDVSKLKKLRSLILTGNPITNKATPTSIPAKSPPSGTPAQPVSSLTITY